MDTHGLRVMICVDKSKYSEYAFEYYLSHLHREGNILFLVHIPEEPTTTTLSQKYKRIDLEEFKRLKGKEILETQEISNKYLSKLSQAQIRGEYMTFYGKPGEALCDAAMELQARLVVIGTRGLGTVRRTILGSVSDHLIHHAHVPVVVCRHADKV